MGKAGLRSGQTFPIGLLHWLLTGLLLSFVAASGGYLTSCAQGTPTQTLIVVAAQGDLKAGTILALNNTVAPFMRIQDAFAAKQIDKKLAPPDVYLFTNQDALNTVLNNKVVKVEFKAGDILLNNDPRLADIGTTYHHTMSAGLLLVQVSLQQAQTEYFIHMLDMLGFARESHQAHIGQIAQTQ